MTTLIDTVQLQSIDDSLVEFIEITLPNSTSIDVRLVSGLADGVANIYFPAEDGNSLNEYVAIPFSMSGVEHTSDGASNRPTLNIANIVSLGRSFGNNSDGTADEETWQSVLLSKNIAKPEDILGSRITHRKTLLKNTYRQSDVSSFSAPTLPVEFPKVSYNMERISAENAVSIVYELASPFDLEGVKLPRRILVGKYCSWAYQGIATYGDERSGCTYANDSTQLNFFDINDTTITGITDGYVATNSYPAGTKIKYPTTGAIKIWESIKNPTGVNAVPTEGSRYWKRIDICGKTLNSCKIRFQGPDGENRLIPLPFGGFPGARKFK